jgi:ABC-type dipeptide/oligopeptide/nickel transport systems, permease components
VFRYLVRRTLWAILLFIVITFITFVIFFVGPNNPARAVCGGEQAKRECLVRATAKLGLDQPMPVQYWKFVKQLVVHQDLGESFATSQSVNQRIKEAAPVTASLVFGGAILWMIIGLSVGIFSALKPRSLTDRFAMVFVLIGVSAHPVWIGLILEYVFGVKLGWTPIANYATSSAPHPTRGSRAGPGSGSTT